MQINGPGEEVSIASSTGCVWTDWGTALQNIPRALVDNKLNQGLDFTPLLSTLWTVSPALHPVLSSQCQTNG